MVVSIEGGVGQSIGEQIGVYPLPGLNRILSPISFIYHITGLPARKPGNEWVKVEPRKLTFYYMLLTLQLDIDFHM